MSHPRDFFWVNWYLRQLTSTFHTALDTGKAESVRQIEKYKKWIAWRIRKKGYEEQCSGTAFFKVPTVFHVKNPEDRTDVLRQNQFSTEAWGTGIFTLFQTLFQKKCKTWAVTHKIRPNPRELSTATLDARTKTIWKRKHTRTSREHVCLPRFQSSPWALQRPNNFKQDRERF